MKSLSIRQTSRLRWIFFIVMLTFVGGSALAVMLPGVKELALKYDTILLGILVGGTTIAGAISQWMVFRFEWMKDIAFDSDDNAVAVPQPPKKQPGTESAALLLDLRNHYMRVPEFGFIPTAVVLKTPRHVRRCQVYCFARAEADIGFTAGRLPGFAMRKGEETILNFRFEWRDGQFQCIRFAKGKLPYFADGSRWEVAQTVFFCDEALAPDDRRRWKLDAYPAEFRIVACARMFSKIPRSCVYSVKVTPHDDFILDLGGRDTMRMRRGKSRRLQIEFDLCRVLHCVKCGRQMIFGGADWRKQLKTGSDR